MAVAPDDYPFVSYPDTDTAPTLGGRSPRTRRERRTHPGGLLSIPHDLEEHLRKIILAVAVAALATMAIVSSASAGVPRYQTQSMTITAVQPKDQIGQFNDVWTHTY